jgi:hypothetical protein
MSFVRAHRPLLEIDSKLLEHSADFETLELILPGDFKTIQLP